MAHFILALYALLFSTGFAGLAGLVFLKLRVKSAVLPYFIALEAVLFFGLGMNVVYFYLGNVVLAASKDLSVSFNPLRLVSILVNCGLYVLVWKITRTLKPAAPAGRLRTLAGSAALTVALLMLVSGAFFLAAPFFGVPTAPVRRWSSPVFYAATSLAILLAGLFFALKVFDGEHPAVRFLIRAYGFISLCFVPLSVLEGVLELGGLTPFHPLHMDYLLFLGWNCASIAAFARVLAGPAEPVLTEVPEHLAQTFGLTAREREMIALIARGLANKQIAAELGISLATVRTHIYNLFQKVEVSSRIELLNKLRD